jgi:hypothetical protein
MIRCALLISFFVFSFISRAAAAQGFETENLVLYQVDEVLKKRLSSVKNLGDYYKKIEAECQSFFAKATQPSNIVVVVAVKPGKLSKIWFIPSAAQAPSLKLTDLQKKLEAIPAFDVYGGPLALAIRGKIAGGDSTAKEDPNAGPPIPQEWQDAIKDTKERVMVPDGFLAMLWPDAPGTVVDKLPPTPSEYVTQVLEPLGGKIKKPKDWHYVEEHRKHTYMWTLSLEDSKKGPYTTGVRIQAFMGIKEATGQSAKDFILDFIKSKKANPGIQIEESCEEKNLGLFTRVCLEIEEGPYHILYSLFWGNDMDVAVVSIAGTSKELWRVYAPTFDKMNTFELIDMKRFEKK